MSLATEPGARPLSAELFDRLPPRSLEAEKGVIGSILLDHRLLDDLIPILRPEHFYRDAHQKLYGMLVRMAEEGVRAIDVVTLADRLRAEGHFEEIGGAAYLAEVLESVPHAANALYYARIVREKALLRHLIHVSTEILRDAYSGHENPREVLAEAERRVFQLLEEREGADALQISEILQVAFDRLTERLERGQGVISGLATGLLELDHLTSGLQDSELIVLASRPSMGKTALALNIADHAAMKEGAAVLVISLEQSRLELAERLLCARAGVDGHKLRSGYLRAEDRRKLVEVSGQISQSSLFIDDTPSRDMLQIAAIARRFKRKHHLRLVVIDYLQLIDPENRRDPRQEQIALITRRLKHMARELAIPVMVLAQLNRAVEMREGHRPRLADLRESGAIEQDADVVMFLHRDDFYDPENQPGVAEVIVAKQRNGPTGTVRLAFMKNFVRFGPLSDEWDEYSPAPGSGVSDQNRADPPF